MVLRHTVVQSVLPFTIIHNELPQTYSPTGRILDIAIMVDVSRPPKSPTLQPPRKSVELEDPGARDLGKSNTFLRAILY